MFSSFSVKIVLPVSEHGFPTVCVGGYVCVCLIRSEAYLVYYSNKTGALYSEFNFWDNFSAMHSTSTSMHYCKEIKPNTRLLHSDFTFCKYKYPEFSFSFTYNFYVDWMRTCIP